MARKQASIGFTDLMAAVAHIKANGGKLTTSPNRTGGKRQNIQAWAAEQFDPVRIISWLRDPQKTTPDDDGKAITFIGLLRLYWQAGTDNTTDDKGRPVISPQAKLTAIGRLIDVLKGCAALHPAMAATLEKGDTGSGFSSLKLAEAQERDRDDDDFAFPFGRPASSAATESAS